MKYKLLVAESVSAEGTELCAVLDRHLNGHITILQAQNGNDALTLFYKEAPHIVILNIEMPGLSGLEVARKIRESSTPCVLLFISDRDNFFYAKQAISLRALDYILKPVEEGKLISAVWEAIHYSSHFISASWEMNHPSVPVTLPDTELEQARLTMVRQDIRGFIHDHYREELSMKNVARAMNYSDAYFCKLFKQCFQTNFSAFLNEYRIEKAKEILESTRINIKDVGSACGYADANYFSRVFKRMTGQTPSAYRLYATEKVHKNHL